jgi:hypothetical protein
VVGAFFVKAGKIGDSFSPVRPDLTLAVATAAEPLTLDAMTHRVP